MRHNVYNAATVLVAVICLLEPIGEQSILLAAAQLTYELTIWVDEGRGQMNGHVWVSLSDGNMTSYYGFYPETIGPTVGPRDVGFPNIFKPGQVRDIDSQRVREGQWTVNRPYRISKEQYKRALDAINAWQNRDQRHWTGLTHCGDFTTGIARAAGVGLDLPCTRKGKDLPAAFGTYLRQHGGIVNTSRTVQTPVVTAPAPRNCSSEAGWVRTMEQAVQTDQQMVALMSSQGSPLGVANWTKTLADESALLAQARARLAACQAGQ